MLLDIKFGIQYEKKRIKNTIERLPWYDNHGYSPRFPENINPKTDDIEKIFLALKNEYDEKQYKEIAKKINKDFSKIKNDFYKKLEKLFGKKIKKNFKLILTKYGVGGSYGPPNKIIYNFEMRSSSINTILHEIVHLMIEPYIIKYHIEQNEKERIVDLILISEITPNNYKAQKRGEECSKYIDPLFKQYFRSSIDNFFKAIKNNKKING